MQMRINLHSYLAISTSILAFPVESRKDNIVVVVSDGHVEYTPFPVICAFLAYFRRVKAVIDPPGWVPYPASALSDITAPYEKFRIAWIGGLARFRRTPIESPNSPLLPLHLFN